MGEQYDDFAAEMFVMLAFLLIYMKNVDEELKEKKKHKSMKNCTHHIHKALPSRWISTVV